MTALTLGTTPTLSTRDLHLTELLYASQEQVDWLNDPKNTTYSEQRHKTPHTERSCQIWLNNFDGHIWAIKLHSREHIGNIAAYIDQPNQRADISMMIHHPYWGRGYGRQAWRRVTDWLFEQDRTPIRKIEAGCMFANKGMRAVLARAGFTLVAIIEGHFLLDGKPHDLVLYHRFKDA